MLINNNGMGFDTYKTPVAQGSGFTNIKERIKILKGEVNIASQIGKGTTVDIKIPIKLSIHH
jgi:signal transduction histidine kinase